MTYDDEPGWKFIAMLSSAALVMAVICAWSLAAPV